MVKIKPFQFQLRTSPKITQMERLKFGKWFEISPKMQFSQFFS